MQNKKIEAEEDHAQKEMGMICVFAREIKIDCLLAWEYNLISQA